MGMTHENLPAKRDADVEEAVFEGEIVDDEPQARPAVVVQVSQTINVVVQHPAVRHASYPVAGAVVAWRRWQRRRSLSQDMAQQANMQGDRTMALQFLQHAELERKGRHDRRMQRSDQRLKWLKALPVAAAMALILMAAVNVLLFIATRRAANLAWSFVFAAHAVQLGIEIAAVLAWVLAFGVPVAVFTAFYRLGRGGGDFAPRWARTAGDADVDHEVTEMLLTNALKNMRFKQVSDYLKTGQPLAFVVSCRQEGRGTYSEIRLPGLAAERVVRRREDFAAGLHRAAKEVWPSVGSEAAILKTWVADKGALEKGAGEYPLLAEGFTDVFKGLPFGKTLRGDPIRIPVIGRNSICGGAPEQGKSNSARVVACGYTLDIITEMRIYVPDANFDFDWFAPRCSRYLVGAEDEVIERMLEEQELLKEEIQERGNLLRDYEMQEVTREIAHAGVGLHPVFILVEEAHVPITHKKFGKDFGQLLGDNVKLCRKRGMHIFVSTQAPVRGAMPRDVTTNCTNGIAHAVADIYANDALLGPGAHSSGHRATELLIPADRGTALCKGFAGEARSEMVQVHRIQASRSSEQVSPIVKRALDAMAAEGRAVPGTGRPLAVTERDLLTDLSEVIDGPWRVNVNDLPDRLRRHAPSWGPYRGLKGRQLRGQLTELGVRTTNTDNRPELDPADLRAAIDRRERMSELP